MVNVLEKLCETIFLAIVFLSGYDILAGMLSLLFVVTSFNIGIMYFNYDEFWVGLPSVRQLSTYLRFGAPMITKELSQKILTHVDKFIIIVYLSPAKVGIYAVAVSICSIFMQISGVFGGSLYPRISSAWDSSEFEAIEEVYSIILSLYLAISIPSIVGLLHLQSEITILISTVEISNNIGSVLPILLVGYILQGFNSPVRYVLSAAEKTWVIAGSVLSAIIINVIVNLMLIPELGLVGAAVATFLSYLVMTVIIVTYSNRLVKISIPAKLLVVSIISAIIMLIALLFIDIFLSYTSFTIYNILIIAIKIIVGVVVYTVSVLIGDQIVKGKILERVSTGLE
jgi:O-antigen/teichoic acid export membrane protein